MTQAGAVTKEKGGDDENGLDDLEQLLETCRGKKTFYRQEMEKYGERLTQIQEEIDAAGEEEKQGLQDYYDEVFEQQQALTDEILTLLDDERAIRSQVYERRMKEAAGKDLLADKKAELEALPEDLTADNAEQYGIYIIHNNREDKNEAGNERARAALWRLYEQTGYGKGTLPEPYEAVFPGDSPGPQDRESVSGRITFMTVMLGMFTDEGQLVIVSVTAWNGGYMILTDQSRDSWKGDGGDILVNYWRYLNWLTSEDGTMEIAAASERERFGWEDWRTGMLSSKIDLFGDHEYQYIAGF